MKSYDWHSVDFGRTNAEIAAELGCPESSVSRARKRYGISRERVDWSMANWAEPDTVIAAKLGVTPRAVGKARLRITGETGRKSGRPRKSEEHETPVRVTLEGFTPEGLRQLREFAEESGMDLNNAASFIVARYLMLRSEGRIH